MPLLVVEKFQDDSCDLVAGRQDGVHSNGARVRLAAGGGAQE